MQKKYTRLAVKIAPGRFPPCLFSQPKRKPFLKKQTQFLAACLLLVGSTGLLAQGVMPVLAAQPQNVAQLSASAIIEVQQDLLSIAMSTTRDGTDSAAVQNQLR